MNLSVGWGEQLKRRHEWTAGIESKKRFNCIPYADSADSAESAFKIVCGWNRIDKMYMKLASGILHYELLVWRRNGCIENHFDLDTVKSKNKISMNKKNKLKKDYLSLFLFSFKIIWK